MKLNVTIINKEELNSLLVQDLDRYIDNFVKYGIEIAQPLIEQYTKEAIESFYGSYRSIYYYDRTGNLKNNSYQSIVEQTGTNVLVGVEISGANMNEYESGVSPSSVVGWTWSQGAHGYPGYPGTQFTYPPISMLEMAIGNIANTVKNKAMLYAQQQKYNVIRF